MLANVSHVRQVQRGVREGSQRIGYRNATSKGFVSALTPGARIGSSSAASHCCRERIRDCLNSFRVCGTGSRCGCRGDRAAPEITTIPERGINLAHGLSGVRTFAETDRARRLVQGAGRAGSCRSSGKLSERISEKAKAASQIWRAEKFPRAPLFGSQKGAAVQNRLCRCESQPGSQGPE